MSQMTELMRCGKELGLGGDELRVFVEEERRRLEKEECDKQDRDREKRAHERDLKRLDLEILEKQMVINNSKTTTEQKPRSLTSEYRPKLPPFDEKKDQLESYIDRFDRYADSQKWSMEDRSIYLGTLLTGRALDVYVRLPPEEANDYDALKRALFRRFQLTEDGFRKKFFMSKPEQNETATQYAFRLATYLDRWIELSEVEKNFEGLRQLFLKDQFISSLNKDLAIFVRERSPKTINESVHLAGTYAQARGWTHLNRSGASYAKPLEHDVVKKAFSNPVDKPDGTVICYRCREVGHLARQCRKLSTKSTNASCRIDKPGASLKTSDCSQLKRTGTCKHNSPISESKVLDESSGCGFEQLPISTGYLETLKVQVLRDTGCSGAVVRRSLVNDQSLTGENRKYVMIDGTVRYALTAKLNVRTPFYNGEIVAICVENPICDLITGNIVGAVGLLPTTVTESNIQVPEHDVDSVCRTRSCETQITSAVQTRSSANQVQRLSDPLKVPDIKLPEVSTEQLVQKQRADSTLALFHKHAEFGKEPKVIGGGTENFVYKKNVLYRIYQSSSNPNYVKQLVVPVDLRPTVLQLGHDAVMAGHLGVRKTLDRILGNFFWSGVTTDVDRYCKSCDVCQKTISKGRVPKVPVQRMPLIDTPFSRIAIDIIGPIEPRTSRGNKYVLTVVDYATRYPEAIALPNIKTETVADALCTIFSRVGVPKEILTDNGSNFTSDMMREFCRLLSIDHLRTTPYHAMCNGLVERFNGTLKTMLRKMCSQRPMYWDRYIEPLLFAYREVPQESLGFSPFELLYGRTIRGPLSILKELWTKEVPDETVKTTYEYVFDLRNRLEDATQSAHSNLRVAQSRYKDNFDRKATQRNLEVNDQALLLLPSHTNKLVMQWKGPYRVDAKVGVNDYLIAMGKKKKVFHINMLKKYIGRENQTSAGLIAAIDDNPQDCEEFGNEILLGDYPATTDAENHNDVHISGRLSDSQREELSSLLHENTAIFSSRPGSTILVEHDIVLTSEIPITTRPYPVPHALVDVVKSEVTDMVSMGIVEPSTSPYRSPLLMVRKKDRSFRPVIDFRKLNKITVVDAEPMSNSEEIFARIAKSRFLTKLDFCKGYWQIKVSEESKPFTAFYTPFGLYQFRRMPFGLVNAGSTYNRMMRKLLSGLSNVESFVDDVLVYSDTWEQHIESLGLVLCRFSNAGLTVKPSKCFFGFQSLEYLGHEVGNGCLRTLEDKVSYAKQTPAPRTKKELRSFLGLTGYYHRFIPNYSTIAAPLTDLTKKGKPNKLIWEAIHEHAFNTLKCRLCSAPILKLPNFSEPFVLRTDASDVGIGAVLLQKENEVFHPISYASRKLLPREKAYSTMEKECLAIIWAIDKYQVYLFGKAFLLQTDHKPLSFIHTAKLSNARIMRWALFLQNYRFEVEAIKGKVNVGADFMSRSTEKPP